MRLTAGRPRGLRRHDGDSGSPLMQAIESGMNRSQLVFVIIVNALFTLLIASTAYLLYALRRPGTEAPIVLEVVTPPAAGQAAAGVADDSTPLPPVGEEAGGEAVGAATITTRTYTIREGDTLGAIADLFGVAQSSLAALNGISNPNLIVPGRTLMIPDFTGAAHTTAAAAPDAADLVVQVLNAGLYAEEVVVIVNVRHPAMDLSTWSVVTRADGAYRFPQMPPLLPGESVRLFSRTGTDTAYDKHWGRTPTIWGPGTAISLHDPNGTEVLSIVVS